MGVERFDPIETEFFASFKASLKQRLSMVFAVIPIASIIGIPEPRSVESVLANEAEAVFIARVLNFGILSLRVSSPRFVFSFDWSSFMTTMTATMIMMRSHQYCCIQFDSPSMNFVIPGSSVPSSSSISLNIGTTFTSITIATTKVTTKRTTG